MLFYHRGFLNTYTHIHTHAHTHTNTHTNTHTCAHTRYHTGLLLFHLVWMTGRWAHNPETKGRGADYCWNRGSNPQPLRSESSLYHLAMLAPGQYFTCSIVLAGRAGSHSGPAGWWCCRRWRCHWSKGSGRLCLLHTYTHAIRHQHKLHIGWVVISSERCCGNTGSR